MADFMSAWLGWDAQIVGKTLFFLLFLLGMTMKVSLEVITILISRWSKAYGHQCKWWSSSPWGLEKNKKVGGRTNLPSLASWNIPLFLPLDISTAVSQAFRLTLGLKTIGPFILRPLNLDWVTPSTSLVFQLTHADHGISWPS